MSLRRGLLLAYLACAAIWGTTWFAIRASIGPAGYSPMTAAALRFSLAALVLAPLVWRARPWPSRAQWGWLVVAGALDALGYALIYAGEREVPGGLAAVISGVQPVLLTVMLIATRLEVVRRRDLASAVVAFVGIAVIFADQLEVSRGQALGVVMVLSSVVASTLYSVVMKRHAQHVHTWVATAIFISVTAAFLWLAAAIAGPGPLAWPPPARATFALVYLAIAGTVVGFGAYFWLLSRVTLVASNLLAFVLPLIALAVDAGFETQLRLGARAYVGITLTLLAVAVSRWPSALAPRRRRQDTAPIAESAAVSRATLPARATPARTTSRGVASAAAHSPQPPHHQSLY